MSGAGARSPAPPLLVVTERAIAVDERALAGRMRDTLALAWEERRWTRKRVVTSGGRTVALALPTGTVLDPGAVIAVADDWYLVVEARPEPVLAVSPRNRDEAIRVAFEVGNRHFPLALQGALLLVPDDPAMRQLLNRLGVAWEPRCAVFDPIGASDRRGDGTAPGDGHPHRHGPHG